MTDPTAPGDDSGPQAPVADHYFLLVDDPLVTLSPVTMDGVPPDSHALQLEVRPGVVVHLIADPPTLRRWAAAAGRATRVGREAVGG